MKNIFITGILTAMIISSVASVLPSVASRIDTLKRAEEYQVFQKQNPGVGTKIPFTKITSEQIVKLASTSFKNSSEKISFYQSNSGISPKNYGMHHVKVGTHKRTNV